MTDNKHFQGLSLKTEDIVGFFYMIQKLSLSVILKSSISELFFVCFSKIFFNFIQRGFYVERFGKWERRLMLWELDL